MIGGCQRCGIKSRMRSAAYLSRPSQGYRLEADETAGSPRLASSGCNTMRTSLVGASGAILRVLGPALTRLQVYGWHRLPAFIACKVTPPSSGPSINIAASYRGCLSHAPLRPHRGAQAHVGSALLRTGSFLLAGALGRTVPTSNPPCAWVSGMSIWKTPGHAA